MYLNSVEYTAHLLFRAVKNASVRHSTINAGDHIIVTGTDSDIIGVVNSTCTDDVITTVILDTDEGEQTLQISSDNFVHIIQRADMLNMRNHIDYERDLVDTDTSMHSPTDKEQRPIYGPCEGKGDHSVLPTSKISLVMKKQKGD